MNEQGRVKYGDTVIAYTVQRSSRRRKTIEILLDPVAGVLIAAPEQASTDEVRALVTRRAPWILQRATPEVLRPRPKEFVSGESVPYLGRQVRLFVEPRAVPRVSVRFTHWDFHLTVPEHLTGDERRAAIERALTRWYKARATQRLAEVIARWSAQAGLSPTAVLVRSQRQRWGSCSPDGTLRFNWRIVMAAPDLIDYVVVHELIHLRVRHHDAVFWAKVARLLPDYQRLRAQLKENGAALTL